MDISCCLNFQSVANCYCSRMDQVLALTAAFDVYVDVSQKTEEGLKFYSTLFTMLNGLREAVEAVEAACKFCFSQY